MVWVKLDDQFYLHPKILKVGPLGLALQVASLCYANSYRTKGFIPYAVLPQLLNLDGISVETGGIKNMATFHDDASVPEIANWLANVEMWTEDENAGGYWIHDYDKYQEAATVSEKRAEAGRLGGLAKAKQTASKPPPSPSKAAPVPVPDPVPNNSSPSSARAGWSARQWYEHVTGKLIGQDKALRQQLDDIQIAHGSDCVAWGFTASIGKDNPMQYAKRIFDSCILGGEGHGPRGGTGGRNGVRSQGSGDHRRKQGKPDGRDTDWAAVEADLERERREAGWYDGDEAGLTSGGVEQDV